jgi:hypothetical protein
MHCDKLCEVYSDLRIRVNKLEGNKNDNGMLQACKSLAERFHYQEQWVSKLHEKIEVLEKQLKDKE